MESIQLLRIIESPENVAEIPRVVVISGPSGTGKGTIIDEAMKDLRISEPDRSLSVSWTTRPRRKGESEDAYHFTSREEFEAKIAENGFLEHAEVFGKYYGTPVPNIDQKVILEIDVQGAGQVRERALSNDTLKAHLFLFVVCDTPDILLQRLMDRPDGAEPEVKYKRYKTFFDKELALVKSLGAHVIVNRSVDHSVANVLAAIRGTYFCDKQLSEVIERYKSYDPQQLDELLEHYSAL